MKTYEIKLIITTEDANDPHTWIQEAVEAYLDPLKGEEVTSHTCAHGSVSSISFFVPDAIQGSQ